KEIVNDFFGHTITVAGLITGGDIICQMSDVRTENILIPDSMLREGTDYFLDDITIGEIEKRLNTKVTVSKVNGEHFVNIFFKEDV
ncbi:MAG: DUF512 domain-containing protein, partial [Gallicola sp.]|nr:DUF512 domain-containing protein [Gallicola sp.]